MKLGALFILKSNMPHQRAPNKQAISFINLTDSCGPVQNAVKRKLVRAHAMRDYQQRKQAQQETNCKVIEENRQLVSNTASSLTLRVTDTEILEHNLEQHAEARLSGTAAAMGWTTSLNVLLNRLQPEGGRTIKQGVGGNWASAADSNFDHNPTIMTGMVDDTNEEYSTIFQSEDVVDGPSLSSSESPSRYLHPPTLTPEGVEYPLSMDLDLSFNSLNSGKIDPFNTLPVLKTARSQALMYHCRSKSPCKSTFNS